MATEDPLRLLGRLRLGREEYCQRLLTMLILGGPYPKNPFLNTPMLLNLAERSHV
ncbi:hypothetical protein [Microbispora bryophytorum]|uniref:Uncharacterized protein n=1 Tax=Microbispora bryophytorum TaxID=1460882 RepID=A0A8H9H994_9ACTN|nr:hypothetical protein [Microbispora bryophytorum]MBD3140268.1 hypothetical protein [Microbispora bryophytorum]GGO26786.1 hypothetical protein GCM10011574_59600 [Microbispora bryophytorum]